MGAGRREAGQPGLKGGGIDGSWQAVPGRTGCVARLGRCHKAETAPRGRDTMRRKIERALAVAASAEELATAAQSVLVAAEAEQIVLNNMVLEALRDALARYREVHGD